MPRTLEMPRGTRTVLKPTPATAKPADEPTPVEAVEESKEPDLDEAGETAYQGLVKVAASAVREGNKSGLEAAYLLGEQVELLKDAPDKYGGAKIERFAKDLAGITGHRFSGSILYKYAAMSESFNKNDLKHFIAEGYALRNILFLCDSKLSMENRKELVTRVDAGEIPQDKLKQAVDAKLGKGNRKSKRSTSPAIVLDALVTISEGFCEKLLDVDAMVVKIKDFKPATREGLKEQVQATLEQFREVKRVLEAKIKALAEIKF